MRLKAAQNWFASSCTLLPAADLAALHIDLRLLRSMAKTYLTLSLCMLKRCRHDEAIDLIPLFEMPAKRWC